MKIAIIHEWLESYAGSERVLEQLLAIFPEADLYAVCDFLPAGERGFLGLYSFVAFASFDLASRAARF
jgi:hypothetical protein